MTLPPAVGVPRSETRVVRLFAIGEPVSHEALKTLLRASHLDPAQVDIFDPADLGEGGLALYLIEGMGIPPGQVNVPQVNALTGTVALIRSRAFKGRGQSLRPELPVRLVDTYKEDSDSRVMRKFDSAGAKGQMVGKPVDEKAISGKVALVALVLLLALVAVMIWIA